MADSTEPGTAISTRPHEGAAVVAITHDETVLEALRARPFAVGVAP